MAIAFNRYVNIVSGVGAGATVAQREFIARLFTTNELIPTETVVEFTDLVDVGNYFGITSEEYLRAQYYFGFVSKNITRPRRISFARWANVDTGAQIFGSEAETLLTQYTAINAGGFTVTLAGVDGVVTGLDLSGATSLADVATTTQAAIRTAGGTFAAVEVTFDAVGGRFNFDSGNTGAETIAVTDGAQDPLSIIGWDAQARLSNGVVAETVTQVVTDSTDLTNNFGSFLFMPVLTNDQYVELASWNQAQNVMFQLMVPVTEANAATLSGLLIGFAGTAMTLVDDSQPLYPEMLPMLVLAATNYNARSSVQNYMFQQDSRLSATVTTTADANIYDPLRVNYYGQTQTAGQQITFYQRGLLGGGATAPISMNTYANEQWLKDFAGSRIMTLLLSLPRVSGNANGRGQLLITMNEVTDAALFNGTFSVGKTLSSTQRLFITEQTGDENAYIQVQNAGFWIDAVIESETNNGVLEFKVVYTLIYSKDDVVRSVDGTHTLI